MKTIFSLLLSFFLLAGSAPRSPGQPAARLDERIQADLADDGRARVLVVLRDAASLEDLSPSWRAEGAFAALSRTARSSQRGLAAELDRQGLAYRPFWIVNALAVEAAPEQIAALAARPDVAYLASDAPARMDLPDPDPAPRLEQAAIEAGISAVGAPALWQSGFTGQGIVVAGADTGVAWQHPALKEAYLGWDASTGTADHSYAWWDGVREPLTGIPTSTCGYAVREPCDDVGSTHGTHTLGTVIGAWGIGMAPGARWMACRNMDAGFGAPSTYLSCLQFFLAPTDLDGNNPDPARHADVINNSYSYTPAEGYTPEQALVFHDAAGALRAAGIFMAVSAGNSGPGCGSINTPPGIEPGFFTVGAVDSTGTIAAFSSRGPAPAAVGAGVKPDLTAPGVQVRSSIQTGVGQYGYGTLSGTSMAAPHVAGAVALLWSARPELHGNVAATAALLTEMAEPRFTSQGCGGDLPETLPNHVYGWGELELAPIALPVHLFMPQISTQPK